MSFVKNSKWLVIAATVLLGGCFDFSANTSVQSNGSLTGEIEVAVSVLMVAMADAMNKNKGEPGLLDFCEKPVAGVLPGLVATSARGMRNDMMTCSIKFKVDDPAKYFTDMRAAIKSGGVPAPQGDFFDKAVFDRLEGNAYRVAYTFIPPQDGDKGKDMKDNPFLPMFMAALANHYVTISISGQRIENTTGQVSEDGKRVTWKIPVTMLMMPPPNYKQEIRADIFYGEDTVLEKAKAKADRIWKALTQ
jgi:hypothetical protein